MPPDSTQLEATSVRASTADTIQVARKVTRTAIGRRSRRSRSMPERAPRITPDITPAMTTATISQAAMTTAPGAFAPERVLPKYTEVNQGALRVGSVASFLRAPRSWALALAAAVVIQLATSWIAWSPTQLATPLAALETQVAGSNWM